MIIELNIPNDDVETLTSNYPVLTKFLEDHIKGIAQSVRDAQKNVEIRSATDRMKSLSVDEIKNIGVINVTSN